MSKLSRLVEMRINNPVYVREHGRAHKYGEFVVQVNGFQVYANLTSGDKYYTPPQFMGQLIPRAEGALVLQGSITESAGARFRAPLWRIVAAFMAALVVVGIVATSIIGVTGLPPLLIGLVGGPLFYLFARSEDSSRPRDFARDAEALERRLSHYVETGSDV